MFMCLVKGVNMLCDKGVNMLCDRGVSVKEV